MHLTDSVIWKFILLLIMSFIMILFEETNVGPILKSLSLSSIIINELLWQAMAVNQRDKALSLIMVYKLK